MHKRINWWLNQDGESWILYGNNAPIGSDPFFRIFDLIETKVSNISVTEVGFLMKTKTETYLCAFNDSLETRFEWLLEKSLWEEKVPKILIEKYKNKIFECQKNRSENDISDIEQYYLKREHIELWLSDSGKHLYATAIYSQGEGDVEIMNQYSEGDMVFLYLETKSKEIYRKYLKISQKRIEIDGIWSWALPLVVKNIGKEPVEINTPVGLFSIPADAMFYLISPEVYRGGVAGC